MPSQDLSVELRIIRFGKRNYDCDGDDYAEVNTEEEDDDVAKRQLWKRFSRLQRSNDFLRDGKEHSTESELYSQVLLAWYCLASYGGGR